MPGPILAPPIRYELRVADWAGGTTYAPGSENLGYQGATRYVVQAEAPAFAGWHWQLSGGYDAYEFQDRQLFQSRHREDQFDAGMRLLSAPQPLGPGQAAWGGGYALELTTGGSTLLPPDPSSLPFATTELFHGPQLAAEYALPVGFLGLSAGLDVAIAPFEAAAGSTALDPLGALWSADATLRVGLLTADLPGIGPLTCSIGWSEQTRHNWAGDFGSSQGGPWLGLGSAR